MTDHKYTTVTAAADVTPEVMDYARSVVEGWYNDGRIDWENVWERMDGTTLNDGTQLDLGTEIDSPAMRKIQRTIRKEFREG